MAKKKINSNNPHNHGKSFSAGPPINLSGPRTSKAEYLDIEDNVKEFADKYVTSEHHKNLLKKQGYPEDKIQIILI